MGEETKVSKTKSSSTLECPPQIRYRTLNPFTYAPIPCWQSQPPFWYKTECENEKYYGELLNNINQYGFSKLPQPEKYSTIFEEMQIEHPERYLPGEIYKGKTPKEPVSMPNMDCPKVWEPKSVIFCTEFDSNWLEPRPLLEDDILEQAKRSKKMIISKLSKDITGLE